MMFASFSHLAIFEIECRDVVHRKMFGCLFFEFLIICSIIYGFVSFGLLFAQESFDSIAFFRQQQMNEKGRGERMDDEQIRVCCALLMIISRMTLPLSTTLLIRNTQRRLHPAEIQRATSVKLTHPLRSLCSRAEYADSLISPFRNPKISR